MQGVIDKYGAGEAAVRAIVAGADMVMVLWFPEKKKEVQQAITDAVKSGRIPQARLDQAVRRVLEHKAKAGLFSEKPLDTTHKLAMLRDKKRSAARRDIQREVATRAITVVKNGGVLPLAPTEKASNTVAIAPVGAFLTPFKQAGASTVLVPMAPTKDRAQKDIERAIAVAQKQRGADAPLTIVVAVYTSDHISLVRALMARIADARVVVVSFGSPWLLNAFPQADATVCSFGWRDDSALAAAHVVLGDKKATGVLPVMLAGVRVMTAGASR